MAGAHLIPSRVNIDQRPKHIDDKQEIAETQMLIHFRPRKSLNDLTPIEVLFDERVSLIADI